MPSEAPPQEPRDRGPLPPGRSRGRAQVDDEESMDATEKTPPQKTAPAAPSPAPASSPEKEPPVRPSSPDLIPVQSPGPGEEEEEEEVQPILSPAPVDQSPAP
ncbi:hypothetical protein F7725_029216, partial [Dissostichus mawsoni]